MIQDPPSVDTLLVMLPVALVKCSGRQVRFFDDASFVS